MMATLKRKAAPDTSPGHHTQRKTKSRDVSGDADRTEGRGARLRKLESFGQQFLAQFDTPVIRPSKPEEGQVAEVKSKEKKSIKAQGMGKEKSDDEGKGKGKEKVARNVSHEGAPPASSSRRVPETIVFGQTSSSASQDTIGSKAAWKAFMSSKVAQVSKAGDEIQAVDDDSDMDDEEKALEKQNIANDRLLSQLLATDPLFTSGAASSSDRPKKNRSTAETLARIAELSTTHAQRSGMAIGRGWGSETVKQKEVAKMPRRMQVGMQAKKGERNRYELQEAKDKGMYDPSLKHLYAGSGKKKKEKRLRGIGMGVGKFKNGVLHIKDGV